MVTNATSNPERFAYAADSTFSRRVAAFSAGYDNGKKWRVGAGLAFSYTDLEMAQTISDRIAESSGLKTLLVASHATGSTLQLRPVFGVQVNATPHVQLGGAFRTSGFSIMRNGTATLDGTAGAGATTTGASFFDSSAAFESKLPFAR